MKLSKIASILLAGSMTAVLVGCGSSDDTTSATSSTTAADGYILATSITTDGENILQAENNNTYNITLSKTATELKGKAININGYIDIDGDGKYDNNDTALAFPLQTKGVTNYVNPVTTLAVQMGDDTLLEKAADFDPVADVSKAADDSTIKSLLILSRMVADIAGNDASKLSELATALKGTDITTDLNDTTKLTSTVGTTLGNANADLKTAFDSVATKVDTVVNLVASLQKDNPNLDVTKVVTALMDTSDTALQKSILEAADVNTTAIDANLTDISNAESAIASAIPKKLALNSITIGDINAPVTEINATTSTGNFGTITVDSTDMNLTDFYDVKIDATTDVIKDLNNTNWTDTNGNYTLTSELGATITITNDLNPSQSVKLSLSHVDVTLDQNGTNPLTVQMTPSTIVTVSQTGLSGLTELSDGQSVSVALDKTITNTDLAFNINTILNNLNTSDTKVQTTIDELNNYFSKKGVYSVSVSLDNVPDTLDSLLTINKLEGKVIIKNDNDANHAPVINNIVVTQDSENLTPLTTGVNMGDTFGLDINATDEDNDTLTYKILDANGNLLDSSNYGLNCGIPTPNVTANSTVNYTVQVCDVYNECATQIVPVQVNYVEKLTVPSDATDKITVDENNTSVSVDDVTATYNTAAFTVNFVPNTANPSNSSATIVVKDSTGTVIGTVSPDDKYNGATFYITYNSEVKSVEYNKDATDDITVQF